MTDRDGLYQDFLERLDKMDWMELHNGQKRDKRERGNPGVVGPPGPVSGGVTYIRKGKTQCPNITGTSLVYNCRAPKSFNDQAGGGSNYYSVYQIIQNMEDTGQDYRVPVTLPSTY